MTRTGEAGRQRARRTALFLVVPLSAVGVLGVAGTASASPPPDHMVTICHRTGSESGGNAGNGYSIITVDVASILGENGHDAHEQVGNGPIGDIIPSFTYDGVYYPGKNGGTPAINRGCQRVS